MSNILGWLFGAVGDQPLAACFQWRESMIAIQEIANILLAASYFALPLGAIWYLRQGLGVLHQHRLLWGFAGAFLFACGLTHVLELLAIWQPIHGVVTIAKAVTAIASGATVALIWPLLPGLVRLPSSQQLAEANERLRREAEAHETTLRELETARRELESRVVERTKELSLVKARFETALHGAKIYVFSQDRDLRHTWMYNPAGEEVAAQMVGRTDEQLLPSPEREAVMAVKRQVLETAQPADTEVSYITPDRRALYALHIDPTFGPDKKVDGIMCAGIDISRIRSLESEQRRLTEELATALQRYETALRGSNITVFTQDEALRYTSVSNALFGREVEDIIGRTDEEILPEQSRASMVAMKRAVLNGGQAKDNEVRIEAGSSVHWYDFHMEPLRDAAGEIVGLTCAAVDITQRKESEGHLRLLMRELTHRSKNLLAVIQAMARQTARHAGTLEGFLEQFNARLQALASSHDLLVQESWYGASLPELVRSQLGHYLDRTESPVVLEGPALMLKPEAAQSLGLAVHELATNAAKYGALSTQTGRVSVIWRRLPAKEGHGIELQWTERGGPPVTEPERRGFGSMVIERNLVRALDAEVFMTFAPEGLQCRINIPVTQLSIGR